MTLIEGRLVPGDRADALVHSSGARLSLPPLAAADSLPDGAMCLLGIRPEHVAVVRRNGHSPSIAELSGEVVVVETTVLDTHVDVATAFGDMTAVLRGRSDLAVGDLVTLELDPLRICLFAANDGRRLR